MMPQSKVKNNFYSFRGARMTTSIDYTGFKKHYIVFMSPEYHVTVDVQKKWLPFERKSALADTLVMSKIIEKISEGINVYIAISYSVFKQDWIALCPQFIANVGFFWKMNPILKRFSHGKRHSNIKNDCKCVGGNKHMPNN